MFAWLKKIFSRTRSPKDTDDLFADWKIHNYEELLIHFAVRETAESAAARNSPSSKAKHPDDFHNNLTSLFKKLIRDRTAEIAALLDSLESTVEKARQQLAFLDGITSNFKTKVSETLERYQPAITEANSAVRSLQEEVNVFKEKNGLTRDAHYPQSIMRYWLLLIVFIVVETIINMSQFAAGSSGGMLGGAFIAFVISLVNVYLGYLVGRYVFKLAWSNQIVFKVLGALGFMLWVVFTVGFNLTVGHVRARYESGDLDAMNTGFQDYLLNPIGLVDFQSWLLVVLGVVFATLALGDGWKSDDKYPGYGALARKLAEAQQLRQAELEGLIEDGNELHEYYLDKGDTAVKDLTQEAGVMRSSHDFARNRIVKEYPEYCDYYESVFPKLIGSYRNYNIEARSDPEPDYFNEALDFTWHRDDRTQQLADLEKNINQISARLKDQLEEWAKERQELEKLKSEFIEEMRSYDSLS